MGLDSVLTLNRRRQKASGIRLNYSLYLVYHSFPMFPFSQFLTSQLSSPKCVPQVTHVHLSISIHLQLLLCYFGMRVKKIFSCQFVNYSGVLAKKNPWLHNAMYCYPTLLRTNFWVNVIVCTRVPGCDAWLLDLTWFVILLFFF